MYCVIWNRTYVLSKLAIRILLIVCNKNKAVLQNWAKQETEYDSKPHLKTILTYFLGIKIT